jgi:hypothetical protein
MNERIKFCILLLCAQPIFPQRRQYVKSRFGLFYYCPKLMHLLVLVSQVFVLRELQRNAYLCIAIHPLHSIPFHSASDGENSSIISHFPFLLVICVESSYPILTIYLFMIHVRKLVEVSKVVLYL